MTLSHQSSSQFKPVWVTVRPLLNYNRMDHNSWSPVNSGPIGFHSSAFFLYKIKTLMTALRPIALIKCIFGTKKCIKLCYK